MRFRRRPLPDRPAPGASNDAPAPREDARPRPCRFVGVSTEPGRGIEPGIGPYQFTTSAGEPVQLHETRCTALTFRPGDEPTFRAVFRYVDGWVPPECAGRPVVVLDFRGARIEHWESDDDASRDATPDEGDDVLAFEWDGHRTFALDIDSARVIVTADELAVSLTSRAE